MRETKHGFSLFDLVITVSVAAVLVTLAAPPLQGTILNARRTTAVNDLVAAVQIARSSAIRRNKAVVICPGNSAQACANDADWNDGWFVFINEDEDHPPIHDPDEVIIHQHGPVQSLSFESNRAHYIFRRIGLRATNGTITVCDRRGTQHARAVIISYTGRPRVTRERSDGSPIACL